MKRYSVLTLFIILHSFASYGQDTLTLEQAIKTALENNFSIQIVRNDVQIAKNNNTIANAGFLPDITATGSQDNSISTTRQNFFDGRQRNASGANSSSLNGSVMLNWTIFQGFNMFIAKNTLQELQEIEELESRMVIENTIASVIITYHDVVSSQMRRDVLRESVSISKERKELAVYKLQIGSVSQIDVYEAMVDLNTDSSALLQQNGILQGLKADLNILMGRDASTSYEVKDSLFIRTDLNYQEILQKVQTQNSQLFLARKNLTLAELNTRYWKSQYFPSISLYGGYNYVKSESEVGLLQSNLNHGPAYGVRASFNIFNGFYTRRNSANAKIQRRSTELELKQTQLQTENELYKAYIHYQNNLALLGLEDSNQITARKNFNIASEKFRLGTINNIELRFAQQNLINSENRYVEARFQAKAAEIELMRLSGEIWGQNQK